ncbi:hypothetical protein ACH0BF_16595 [Pseudobacillus sp. 179-B 2D1 NHS]|uniref:hypothetical protein n=1 Tax=Pseudobacillus sp. 179-B 2D1 NHS TaxID=3374292 RepID=UPI00387A0914
MQKWSYEAEELLMFPIHPDDVVRDSDDPFFIPDEYAWLTTDSIGKNTEGKQKWIGRVIGKNQQYIHFRDSTHRKWIFVKNKIDQIQIHDLVIVHVDYKIGETVKANDIFILKEVSN